MSQSLTRVEQLKASTWGQQLGRTSPAAMGVGRVALGILLLWDLLRRVPDMDVWYTNAGLMPNHTMLWAPQAREGFSIFFSVSQLGEAAVLFVLIGFVYAGLLVGWRTKLMQGLALFAHVCLDCRIHYLTNGGDVALSVLLVWTLFLPLGEWLSIDALKKKLRHSRLLVKPDGVAELLIDTPRAALFERPKTRFEWAIAGIVVQLAVIYFFNFVHKDGIGWREGTVVHDVLHQDRIVTTLGLWLRPYLPPWASQVMTQTTRVFEASLPALLLLPRRSNWLRRLTVLVGISLHVGFALMINLGIFSPAMIGFWLFLIPPEDIENATRWLSRAPRQARLYFDASCGVCSWVARLLLCIKSTRVLDTTDWVLVSNEVGVQEQKVTEKQLDGGLLWATPDGKKLWGATAVAELFEDFILLRSFAWVWRLGIAERAYAAFAARRHLVSQFFGMGVCGIKRTPEPFDPEAPAELAYERWLHRFGRAVLLYVGVCFVIQVLAQNRAVPESIKPRPPLFVELLVEYTHFYQGWGMFAVSPRTDSTVVVRATTVDGRLVDPLSERASPRSPPGASVITDRLDHSEYFCDYLSRIADDRAYQDPLRDWILAYPKRTGNQSDTIQRFQIVQLNDATPPMDQNESTNRTERVLMTWP